MADLRRGMPAIACEQDSEIDINEGSFDETPDTPIAGQDPENYYNDHKVTVAETVAVSTLSHSSSESRPVNVRSNMPPITIRDSEIEVDTGSSDRDVDKTPAKPAAKECSENHDDERINHLYHEMNHLLER